MRVIVAVALASVTGSGIAARAETVDVKYRGPVDLAPFACSTIPRSSLVEHVCFDAPNRYMLISLRGTFNHYCAIDAATVRAFLDAPSMGRFFSALGGVIGEAQPAIIEEAGKCGPSLEAVVDGFGGLILGGESGARWRAAWAAG